MQLKGQVATGPSHTRVPAQCSSVCRLFGCTRLLTLIATSLLDLQRWRDLVIESDPDIIIGYNIVNFDLPYLIERAETLNIKEFPFWGRLTKK